MSERGSRTHSPMSILSVLLWVLHAVFQSCSFVFRSPTKAHSEGDPDVVAGEVENEEAFFEGGTPATVAAAKEKEEKEKEKEKKPEPKCEPEKEDKVRLEFQRRTRSVYHVIHGEYPGVSHVFSGWFTASL